MNLTRCEGATDRLSNELLTLRRSAFNSNISIGELIAGPLHATGRGDYVTGLGTITISEEADAKLLR